ncbi:TetR/AcrR family transcriptional regulator [Salinibacterium sp. G-O1]|uniref:TetR/AcrR family transcriptional regulator n=1 Tax=Salinibacterium sp. G-O1 TaxID=3046208 RepID=UPI0024B98E7E|nr:TetR/AcrR family transcriptional regulator [Salinibacterium sp. G-O1]MDJ0334098.1 TetR/AcrR family transcriptional regulator [Salinibacterium sp. G-O1]
MVKTGTLPAKDVRSAILTEATRLFKENGVDGISMRQIADAIGYSATTIYLHFTDKNHLMYAVCEAGFAEFGESLGAAASSTSDPLEQLRAVGRAYVEFGLTHPLHYDVMFIRPRAWAIGRLVDEIEGADRPEPESFVALITLVAVAMKSGALRSSDPREAAAILWSGMHGVVSLSISLGDQIDAFEPDEVRRRAATITEAILTELG